MTRRIARARLLDIARGALADDDPGSGAVEAIIGALREVPAVAAGIYYAPTPEAVRCPVALGWSLGVHAHGDSAFDKAVAREFKLEYPLPLGGVVLEVEG